MSKIVKQMEMADLTQTFSNVRDLVMLSVNGLTALDDYNLRKALRQKQIYLRRVKNTFTRKVFGELGMPIGELSGITVLAWGSTSLKDLSVELSQQVEKLLKKTEKVKFKGALADGQEVTFEQALKMPTRLEAIGRVVGLILAPASRLAGQIMGPGGMVAGAVKSVSEKKPEEAAPAEGVAPPA